MPLPKETNCQGEFAVFIVFLATFFFLSISSPAVFVVASLVFAPAAEKGEVLFFRKSCYRISLALYGKRSSFPAIFN